MELKIMLLRAGGFDDGAWGVIEMWGNESTRKHHHPPGFQGLARSYVFHFSFLLILYDLWYKLNGKRLKEKV